MLRIKLVKSPIGNTKNNRAIISALGLRKVQQVVEKEDTASIRGMVHKVKHMITVETVDGTAPVAPKRGKKAEAAAAATATATAPAAEKKPRAKKAEATAETAEVKEESNESA